MRVFCCLVMLSFGLFSGCKKADSVPYDPTQLILHTWVPIAEEVDGTSTSGGLYFPGCSENTRMNFTAQGQLVGIQYSIPRQSDTCTSSILNREYRFDAVSRELSWTLAPDLFTDFRVEELGAQRLRLSQQIRVIDQSGNFIRNSVVKVTFAPVSN